MTWSTRPQTGHVVVESDRIHACPVFDHDGVYVGRISRLLIDRRTGHVEDVVVHTKGRFGFGQTDVYVQWHSLRYDTRISGYRASERFPEMVTRSSLPGYDSVSAVQRLDS
jgi:sporulation protein YlmC with PRC-barrel domain